MTFITNCISIFYEMAVTMFKYFTTRKQTDLETNYLAFVHVNELFVV